MKNVQIEFWRFAFAIYMVIYHTLGHVYATTTGGYIGVDVFAIIAGFFLAASHEKRNAVEPGVIPYIIDRFKRLWPMYISAYVISEALRAFRSNLSFTQTLEQIDRSFPEMFMLKIKTSVNGVAWFVAAMLISGILLWVCLAWDTRQKWMPGLLFIIALLIYGMFLQTKARIHFTSTQDIVPFGYDGLWRVFADMSMGVFAFSVVQNIKEQIQDKTVKLALSAAGNIGFMMILVISLFRFHNISDFWYIFIAWCAVVCLMLSERREQDNMAKAICYLGGLAYPIFLLHEAVWATIRTCRPISSPLLGCVAVTGITFIEAAFLNWLLSRGRIALNHLRV